MPKKRNTLTWFHFSDLHMSNEDTLDQSSVITALWEDIDNHMNSGLLPDFVAFSGDIAYHSDKDEYDLAIKHFFKPLIHHTHIDIERLIIVPGNHDVYWQTVEGLNNPLPKLTSKKDLRYLEKENIRKLYSNVFDNYLNYFYFKIFKQKDSDPLFNLYRTFDIGKEQIALCGLNSAWLSGFNKNKEGNVDDDRNLAIGKLQVSTLLENTKDSFLRIAVCHHPMETLLSIDRSEIEGTIRKSFDFLLNGHLHDANILQQCDLAGDINIVKAGPVFDSSNMPNSYNIVQLDLSTGMGKVILRKYNEKRNEWQKDIESTGEEKDGVIDIEVSKITRNLRKKIIDKEYPDLGKRVDTIDENPLVVFDRFKITFTEKIKKEMKKFNLAENQIIDLVKSEFRSHINYFRYDIEGYPMPVKLKYIISISKIGNQLEFQNIMKCTHNEVIMASWNNILSCYRRSTRLAYREDPHTLLKNKGMINRTYVIHEEIRKLMEKHFFENNKSTPKQTADEVKSYLNSSKQADKEALEAHEMLNIGDIFPEKALSLIVPSLERSLQYLHKILILFPPS